MAKSRNGLQFMSTPKRGGKGVKGKTHMHGRRGSGKR